jgi:hypothetical protein
METKPITDLELDEIQNGLSSWQSDRDWGMRLVAEVRRLRAAAEVAELEGMGVQGLGDALFSANVEIDNLRKRVEDLTAERNHERHQKELRHQAWLEATGQAKPIPMCKPDALDDLFPPARGEGFR